MSNKERDWKLVGQLIKAIIEKFEDNAYKGGWRELSDNHLLDRIRMEIKELVESVEAGDGENSIKEAADVALFSVFYADEKRERKKILLERKDQASAEGRV